MKTKGYPLAVSSWDEQEIEAINKVVESGRFTMGPRVEQFEEEFAKFLDVGYAVMVNSGSSANLLMLALLKHKYGLDRRVPNPNIIVPTIGWSTTFFPVTQNGFILNFVDVNHIDFTIDANKIENAIDNSTVAIFPVNLCGTGADYRNIRKICARHNLMLIEDNCEALGAKDNDKFLGTLGTAGSHSFFFSHHIQTMEGGMITVNDKDDRDFLKSLRAHGWVRELADETALFKKSGEFFRDSFTFVTPGYSVRPLEMSGAIGSVQLKKFPKMLEARRKNSFYFKKMLKSPSLYVQEYQESDSSVFSFGCVLRGVLDGKRDLVIDDFENNAIEARPIASGNFLNQPVLKYLPHYARGEFKASEYIDKNGFWLGNHAQSLKDEIDLVKTVLDKVVRSEIRWRS
jgi:CDP-4-dehydro-6-deoxyglucose reductase, E1